MSLPKLFLTLSIALFVSIAGLAIAKRVHHEPSTTTPPPPPQEVNLSQLIRTPQPPQHPTPLAQPDELAISTDPEQPSAIIVESESTTDDVLPLFAKDSRSPIVETISYASRAPWKRGRPAWLIDYANHYKTSLDFIYRSIRGTYDPAPKTIAEGTRFNVLRNDVEFRFHIVVSLASCRARLYYVLARDRKVVFLKTYSVCLGRKDPSKPSGHLTPLGTYELGARVATFRPGTFGAHKGKKVELMQVFGSHWMPFATEIEGCSERAKGYGIHGTPMVRKTNPGRLEEDASSIGRYESDGCIRLSAKDIRELFSIVSTHKTYVEIVPTFQQSKLLGV